MAGRHFINARRCPRGCLWLHGYKSCPGCGAATTAVKISARAALISHTVVRVNPSGAPITLGVARARGGAATLCIVEGNVRGNGYERVTLVLKNGRYRALTGHTRSGHRRRRRRALSAPARSRARFKGRSRRYAIRANYKKN